MKQVDAVAKGECEGCYYRENKIICIHLPCSDDKIWVQEDEK